MTGEYENTLRKLIISLIGDSDNANYKVSANRLEIWKNKREIERKRFKGVLKENRIIYYSDFHDLETIIDKNWNMFEKILGKKKRFQVFFKEMEKFRNPTHHGRNLNTTEINLLKGITSDLKNTITIYHNKNEMKEDYFIKINNVSDNLGNSLSVSNQKKITLRDGDEYELIIEANDPKDREIHYSLSLNSKKILGPQLSNRFNFVFTKDMVNKHFVIIIKAKTPSEIDYENSDEFIIIYHVLPKN